MSQWALRSPNDGTVQSNNTLREIYGSDLLTARVETGEPYVVSILILLTDRYPSTTN